MDGIGEKELVEGLAKLGLGHGDVLFVHASLSAFGWVEGGETAVVNALLASVGASGTVSVPTFGDYFQGENAAWDPDHSPSRMGKISECVRCWPGARRSLHAIHPVSAVGPRAADLVVPDHETDFDTSSPFQRLIDWNAQILLLGVDWNVCTLLHAAEERHEVRYRRWVERKGQQVEGGKTVDRRYRFLERYPGVRNDFLSFGKALEARGSVTVAEIGNATCKAIRASCLHDEAMAAVASDPLTLVHQATRSTAKQYM
jgi:aminoglycoside 3-N-acetyltransferase